MTIDRRKIFTVGMVWTDFVKRLPRDYPRYRKDYPPNFTGFTGLGTAQISNELAAAMRAQQQAQASFFPFPPYPYQPPQYPPHAGNWFSILGL